MLHTIGINHKTAPVELRERLTFAPDQMGLALKACCELPGVHEAAILSTCNRTELYCHMESDADQALIQWLADYHGLQTVDIKPVLYAHPDSDMIRHMLRVASGLDSLVLGEPQILGQMKDAYHHADKAGTLGPTLNRLFQHIFTVAKQIRTDTSIGDSPVSVAFAAVRLAGQIFGNWSKHTALLIGAGETIELTARHLHEQGIGRMIIANRTAQRAHELAGQFDAYAVSLDEIPAHLADADIIISSTASPNTILKYESVYEALKTRKHRPMFMVDIAVPRDIDSRVAELEDVYLYTVDDLKDVIEDNLRSRREAAQEAEEIIEVQVTHFLGWLRSMDSVSTIRALRSEAENTRDEVLEKAMQRLAQGKPAEEVLQYLSHTLTNKLIHQPSVSLREASFQGRQELIKAVQDLYKLPKKQD